MLPPVIIKMIERKFGKEKLTAGDCAFLAREIGVGEATVKRMLGLVGKDSPERNRVPRGGTMDLLAKWLEYDSYKALIVDIGEQNFTSEFTAFDSIDVTTLDEGTQVQIQYDPKRVIVMTYLGNRVFLINESKNSKLLKGDRISVSYLVLGQELLVSNIVRDGISLGGYRGAKDGGLTSIEIIA